MTRLTVITLAVVIATECAADQPVENPQHEQLLAGAVAEGGYPTCDLRFATYKGRYESAVWYVVGCKSGEHYVIRVKDPSGDTTVTDCDLARMLGADCFAPWD